MRTVDSRGDDRQRRLKYIYIYILIREGEVKIGKVAGDHQGIDRVAPPLCTINRGTAGVDLRKKKERLKGEESPPLLRAGHRQWWPLITQITYAIPVHGGQGRQS